MTSLHGRLANKCALITGASRGIGAAVAKRYAKEGAHVLLLARTISQLEEVDDEIKSFGGQTSLIPMDLMDGIKIDALGAQLFERFKSLDILVGNAGILGGLSPITHVSPKTFDQVFSTNLTANWRLLRSMDPLLRNAPAGRAIFVTSGLAQFVLPYYGPYAASKAALEMIVKTYASEIGHSKVRANLVDPGIVQTAMRAEAMPGEDPSHFPIPEAITEVFVALAEESCQDNGTIHHARDYQLMT